jgi:SAM-dependent methyltransferase
MRIGDYLIQTWRIYTAARWIPKGSRVLDVGCYQGDLFKRIDNKIAPSVGIDPLYKHSEDQNRHQYLPIRFEGTLPFPDDSFDVVVLLATIEHMQDKFAIALESWRILRNGGRMVITVPSALVDKILDFLIWLHVVDGMSLEEHHGFEPSDLPVIFEQIGFTKIIQRKFQFGLNNLFVFEKTINFPCRLGQNNEINHPDALSQ